MAVIKLHVIVLSFVHVNLTADNLISYKCDMSLIHGLRVGPNNGSLVDVHFYTAKDMTDKEGELFLCETFKPVDSGARSLKVALIHI